MYHWHTIGLEHSVHVNKSHTFFYCLNKCWKIAIIIHLLFNKANVWQCLHLQQWQWNRQVEKTNIISKLNMPLLNDAVLLDWSKDQNKMLADQDLQSWWTPHLVRDTWTHQTSFYDSKMSTKSAVMIRTYKLSHIIINLD